MFGGNSVLLCRGWPTGPLWGSYEYGNTFFPSTSETWLTPGAVQYCTCFAQMAMGSSNPPCNDRNFNTVGKLLEHDSLIA